MIVSHEHRFVYVALPHTASTSTRSWLVKEYGGVKEGADHSAYFPKGCEDYLFWTITRDPFDMACAMWRKFARRADHDALWNYLDHHDIPPPGNFADFTRMLATPGLIHFPDARRFVHWPPLRHGKPIADRFDYILDFEEMPDCLTMLPFVSDVTTFPHYNRNGADLAGWETPDTPETRALVREWTEVNG